MKEGDDDMVMCTGQSKVNDIKGCWLVKLAKIQRNKLNFVLPAVVCYWVH